METCKITILVDNQLSPNNHSSLLSEHGLSMLIEVGEWKMLCDMGASATFANNAEKLNIDLNRINAAFLSHAHADHTGGLRHFITSFPYTKVWLSDQYIGHTYFSSRLSHLRDISTDNQLFTEYPERFNWVKDSCWLTPTIAIVRCDVENFPLPRGNAFLTTTIDGVNRADDFSHELSLAILTSKGLVVVSSCSHKGALNILHACSNFTHEQRVRAFVGGLHLVDSHQVKQEVQYFASYFKQQYPDTQLYTGHCTGNQAKEELCSSLPQTKIFHTGMSIEFVD